MLVLGTLWQIVPILAYLGLFIVSERSFYLAIDIWSRKVVAWDVAERKDTFIAADLVSRACLRERISKGRLQPLILHADNGHPGKPAGGAGCAQILLQAKGQQRQPLFGIAVPHLVDAVPRSG